MRRIYGYPGDGINGITGALHRADGAIDFVQVRHEELAAFMACAHAKFTGESAPRAEDRPLAGGVVERGVASWWKVLAARALGQADPMQPQRMFWELSSRLAEGSILTGDAGTGAIWMARDLRLRRGMSFSL